MAFSAPSIESIYHEINLRKNDLGRLSLVEFDDEEYETLCHVGQMIIRDYEGWVESKQKKARVVFLGFACEYVRRTKYASDDDKFWDDFEKSLHIDKMQYRALISEKLLWQSYAEEGIEQRRGNFNRLIVGSLSLEVEASRASREELIAFFCWYYQSYTDSEVTPQLIREYEEKTQKPLDIFKKAIPHLNKDCQALALIITYAIEHNLYLARSDVAAYNWEIVEALGIEYAPTRLHLIRSKEQIRTLIVKLENHCNPTQFLHTLQSYPEAIVQVPKGDTYPAYKLFRYWRTRDFPYGLYKIDNIEYRVVPLPWLWLETVTQWPYEEVVPLQRKDYIAYKKQQPFEVHIGKRVIKGRLCIPHSEERCYVWVDIVPSGERLVIDGQLYRESEGIDWAVSLRLHIDEGGKPIIAIVFDWLKAFFPEQIGHRIVIRTSQNHEWIGSIRLDGTCQLHRAIVFPLNEFAEPITLSIYLGEEFLDSKVLSSESAYLFSYQTHECIPVGTQREWGEYQYYLFAALNKDIQAGEGIEIERLDIDFGSYRIYRVNWKDNKHAFSLHVGDISWNFQRQSYFLIQVKPQYTEGVTQLTVGRMHRFSQVTIDVLTNKDPIHTPMACQVFFGDELIAKKETTKCLQPLADDDRYRVALDFLRELDNIALEHYGKYDILFTENGQILDQTTVALIPEIKVTLPDANQPLLEGETLLLQVFSPYLSVWDPTSGQIASTATLSVRPRLLSQLLKLKGEFTEGLMCLTSQMIAVPVIFPTIGEMVNINVCPTVFGFRLYQKEHNALIRDTRDIPYRQTNELDYYMLEAAVLYVFTKANCNVSVCVDRTVVISRRSDTEGNVFIRELGFLKRYCHEERTFVSIISGGLESTFCIRWTPFINNMIVKDTRVSLDVSGPYGTGISLQLVDLNNKIQDQQLVMCEGEHFSASVELPSIESTWGQCYLVPMYYLSDGIQLSSTWQWRINLHKSNAISTDWLQMGIGIPSEEFLQTFIVE